MGFGKLSFVLGAQRTHDAHGAGSHLEDAEHGDHGLEHDEEEKEPHDILGRLLRVRLCLGEALLWVMARETTSPHRFLPPFNQPTNRTRTWP